MRILCPFVPYLLAGFLYGMVRLYFHLCCRTLPEQWKEVNLKLEENPEDRNAQERKEKLNELISLFPECLLRYRLFTFPYDPINLHKPKRENESR